MPTEGTDAPAPEPVTPDEPAVQATPEPVAPDTPAEAEPEAAPEPEPEPAALAEPEPAAVAEPEPAAAPPPPPPPPPPGAQAVPPAAAAAAAVPPPPPPPGYAPVPAPGYAPAPASGSVSVGDAIGYGWKGFTANVGSILLIVLVVVVVGGGLNVLATSIDNTVLSFIVSLIGFVVGFFLSLGLIRAALTVADGEKPNVGELFQGEGVAQYAIASIVLGLAFALLNLVGLVTIILLPATFLVTLVLSFFVQFFGYSILDDKVSAFEGIGRSFDVVKKNFGELLLLWLAALAINIAGALLCGVGLLVSLPVTAIAWAYAWRRLTGGVVAPLA
jgi:hypothetical protein